MIAEVVAVPVGANAYNSLWQVRNDASHGKSIVNSHWIRDMVDFYGLDIFLAETSATCGGLDSLLEPTGPLREAQQLAATTFGSRQTYLSPTGPRPRTRSSRRP
jgi:Orn/Lys/Arg decarboxylase, major domain